MPSQFRADYQFSAVSLLPYPPPQTTSPVGTVLARSTPALSEMDRTPQSSNLYYYGGVSLSLDPNVMEVEPSSSSTSFDSKQKRKRNQLLSHDVIEIGEDDDQDAVVIIGENLPNKGKKQPMDMLNCTNHEVKDFFPNVHGSSSSKLDLESTVATGKQKVSVLDTLDFSFHEESSYGEYHDENDFYDEYDYDYDYDYDMDVFGNDTMKFSPVIQDEIDIKFKAFKQFDTVRDHSDHYFSKTDCHSLTSTFIKITPVALKPCKDWAKTIQHEWKVLENDLPEKIFVRVYEDRMDLLRAVIIGPAGTPYHDGLFFFDIYFPPTYPYVPPMVHYHSGGLRLNPNLYESGKVCLSLLNTWSGHGCERWDPSKSTMLQVLVSIQALVLNSKPYFNEPGYANLANTPRGEEKSLDYNEKTFILSCKTMLYSLRKPPKHFEDFVAGHFRSKGQTILVACKAYIEGAQVGCVVGDGVQDVDEGDKSSSSSFKKNLRELFEQLLMEFAVKGADCDKILAQKVIDGAAKAAAAASSGSRHI